MPSEISVAFADPTIHQRGIGVVAPFDFALDRELWRWAPEDVSLYLTRMPFLTTPMTVDMAEAIADPEPVRRATRDVLTPRPGVVSYACTSGSFVGGIAGERAMTAALTRAGEIPSVTTSGALIEATRAREMRLVEGWATGCRPGPRPCRAASSSASPSPGPWWRGPIF